MVSGSRGQVVSDRPESGQGVVEADGVLGHRPRRQFDADRPGLEVDVQHLPVNPQGLHDLPVREWHPQLMPVMAARHAGVEPLVAANASLPSAAPASTSLVQPSGSTCSPEAARPSSSSSCPNRATSRAVAHRPPS